MVARTNKRQGSRNPRGREKGSEGQHDAARAVLARTRAKYSRPPKNKIKAHLGYTVPRTSLLPRLRYRMIRQHCSHEECQYHGYSDYMWSNLN